jgi:hypothetical protein
MPRLSDAPAPRAIPTGPWTHDALRHPAGWAYPLRNDAPEFDGPDFIGTEAEYLALWGDRSRPHTVHLESFSPEHGEGWSGSALREVSLARWMHGISGSFCFMVSSDPRRRRERELQAGEARGAYAMLADFDWMGLDFRLLPSAGSPAERKERAARRSHLEQGLREIMAKGLRRSAGEVVPESEVYAAFVSRRIEVEGLGVCESCQIVFPTRVNRPGKLCLACRRHPPRYRCYPLVEGGWHVHARLGPPAHHFLHGRPGQPRKAFYVAICSACGVRFESNHASRRLCRNCGGPSGRVRRRRGGSRLGRQLFRFVGEADSVSVGVRHGDGSQGTISSDEHGVIETADAEIASQLEANTELRRIE